MLGPEHAVAEKFNQGLSYHQAGRLQDAEALYRQVLIVDPAHADSFHLIGVVAHQLGRNEAAVDYIGKAIELNPASALYHFNLAVTFRALGRLEEAEASCRAALHLNPDYVDAYNNFGNILRERGRLPEAEAAFRAVTRLAPDYSEGHYNLGTVLKELRRFDEAESCLNSAVRLKPDFAEARSNLGATLKALGRLNEAEACYRAALQLKPNYAEAHSNLGEILIEHRRLDEAEVLCRSALRLNPNLPEAHNNLGNARAGLGRWKEAEACFRQALRLRPSYQEAHSNLIFALEFISGTGPELLQEERRRWYETHGKKFSAELRPHDNTSDPERRLRVGYVSGDFRRHSAAFAFGPILLHSDPARFEVFCYSNVASGMEDEVTQTLRAAVAQWRPISGLDDDAVAAQIRADRIDILVDCSGHTSGNRLLVFARKPAPVQVSGWGAAGATLMPTIDYLFGDPVAVPHDLRPLFYETVVDLPCWVVYDAPADAPPVSSLPARDGTSVTFGCLNRVSKLSDATLDLWGRLLAAVPGARLLLKDPRLDEPSVRARILEALVVRQVGAERIVLLGRTTHAEHLAAYRWVDIALDPFPQSGGITTLEALWMGVPVVTVPGRTGPSRATAAILSALGLHDWVASSVDEYLKIATARAADIVSLTRLRQDLRPRLAAAIGNADQYTRTVESAYRDMWQRWCVSSDQPPVPLRAEVPSTGGDAAVIEEKPISQEVMPQADPVTYTLDSDIDYFLKLQGLVKSGSVHLQLDIKQLKGVDSPVAMQADAEQWAYGLVLVAGLVWWGFGFLPAMGALAIWALAYIGLGRRIIARNIRKRVHDNVLKDISQWRLLWRYGGISLVSSAALTGQELVCMAPQESWIRFLETVLKNKVDAEGKG